MEMRIKRHNGSNAYMDLLNGRTWRAGGVSHITSQPDGNGANPNTPTKAAGGFYDATLNFDS